MTFDIKKYSLLNMDNVDEDFQTNFITDQFPSIYSFIKNSINLIVIIQNKCISFDDCTVFSDFFNSNDLTLNQKGDMIQLIDTMVFNNLIKKDKSIFELVLSFLSTNENSNEISGSIFDCMIDLICPFIIKIFPSNFYDIIKTTNNDSFISQIALKISQKLPRKNSCAKINFIEFLMDISESVNDDTAFFIYSSHLNIYFLFPDYFPLMDFDFYINGLKYDLETQSIILELLSNVQNCSEIFEYQQIQDAIFLGIQNKESISIVSQSIRALANMLYQNLAEFKKNYNDFFQELITYLNSLIFESSFNLKSDASYLLTLLMCTVPRYLINNIYGYNDLCDIRMTILAIFDLDIPALSLRLMYGLESIYLIALKTKNVDNFIVKINEFQILDRINDLTEHENFEISETAIIIYNEISR